MRKPKPTVAIEKNHIIETIYQRTSSEERFARKKYKEIEHIEEFSFEEDVPDPAKKSDKKNKKTIKRIVSHAK